jgi:hypothetical protein
MVARSILILYLDFYYFTFSDVKKCEKIERKIIQGTQGTGIHENPKRWRNAQRVSIISLV